jgi:hypothetical protein
MHKRRRSSQVREVWDILRYERPLLGEGCGEDLLVRRTFEPSVLAVVDGDDVVPACAERLRGGGRMHLVEEDLTREGFAPARVLSSTITIQRSISSGNSA